MIAKNLKLLRTMFQTSVIQNYLKSIESIPFGNGYPVSNYFGFNYEENKILNLKLYFNYFRRLEQDDINKLIPNYALEIFNSHYKFYKESKIHDLNNTGCTFGIKVNPDGIPTYYFHIRLNGTAVVLPKYIQLDETEKNHLNNTVCFEFRNGEIFSKQYFLIFNKETINSLINKYELKYLIQLNYLPTAIEYTETNKWSKIILAITDKKIQQGYVNSLREKDIVELSNYLCKKNELMTGSSSVYENKKRKAMYFVDEQDELYFSHSNAVLRLKNELFTEL